jgi:hypothetical protein
MDPATPLTMLEMAGSRPGERVIVGVNLARVTYVRELDEDKSVIVFGDPIPAITVYAPVAQLCGEYPYASRPDTAREAALRNTLERLAAGIEFNPPGAGTTCPVCGIASDDDDVPEAHATDCALVAAYALLSGEVR